MNDLLLIRADLAVPIGLALATLVTIHILLRKREVASAVGWIGLAWFAPITGALLYFVFGINRVQRRARRLRPRDDAPAEAPAPAPHGQDRHLEPLMAGIARITARPLLPGNDVRIYQDGDEAYGPMLAAIAAARRSVGLASYIFRNDHWGGRFIDALTAAHGRGVAVRVLIDGVGGGWLTSPAYHRLRRAGVPAARFLHSPLPWRMPFLNLRNHRKLLVVDGTLCFTGGMNIADENVLATHPKAPVLDTHFRIEGPVVGQLAEAFAQDWSFATDEDIAGDAWFPQLASRGAAPARTIDSGPDADIEKVEFAILQALACAREHITIMTPYFLPDARLITALALAAMRGVGIDIVVPLRGNHRTVDWAMRANVGPLLSAGARIWLAPPPFRHSKIMVVDACWCLVGSANWDNRSFRLNFELCVELYDRALAEALTGFVERNFGKALTREALKSRSVPVRLRDAGVRLLLPYL